MKLHWVAIATLPLFLLGCNRGAESKDAVRQGVMEHLAKRAGLDLSAMQVDVTAVAFRQNEADATVSFRPKGGGGAGMEMRYTLERQGNRWVVKGRTESGGAPHSGAMPLPPSQAPGGQMPAGHPPVGAQKDPGTTK